MTTILNQVTCSLCNMKTDELKCKEHLVSTKFLQLCKDNKDKIAIKPFEMVFNACPKQNKLYILESEKTHEFWQIYFSTKLPKEKFITLCSNSIDNLELETGLSVDFQNFIQNVTPDIGETYFNLMDKIMVFKNCSIEVNKSLLFDHINSKEHRDIEKYFIMKCMTYCESCDKGIKNDEWREQVISEKRLEFEDKFYCDLCKKKFSIEKGFTGVYHDRSAAAKGNHTNNSTHKQNQERLGFQAS